MKLGKTAVIEIMACVLSGMSTGTDISEKIRQLDLIIDESEVIPGVLELSDDYLATHPRESDWNNN